MTIKATSSLATLYHALAESLSEPVEWIAEAGREWTLYSAALELSQEFVHPLLQQAIVEMAAIPPEGLRQRQLRYQKLLAASDSQPITMYESMAVEGRLYGGVTLRVWSLYRAAGLNVNESALPDHVSIELAFLSYLVKQEDRATSERGLWHKARREFIRQHAKRWMPSLGRSIARSCDAAYRPIGLLLTAIIQAETLPPQKQQKSASRLLPHVVESDNTCTLCSFCARVCPTHALTIHETHDMTTLRVMDANCVSCDKCTQICPANVMLLKECETSPLPRVLYESAREQCPGCGVSTISRAEIDAITAKIGHPRWLDYCNECRIIMMEELR